MGGAKLNRILRAGSDQSGSLAARALCVMPATTAAPTAVRPITTVPHPDTAVKVAAASMVSLMKRRLSMARACISGGSGG